MDLTSERNMVIGEFYFHALEECFNCSRDLLSFNHLAEWL
jgi:hypothetical protein